MQTKLFEQPRFRIAGDQGLLMELGDGIDIRINERVRAVTLAIEQAQLKGVIEIVPTYRSVVVMYDPLQTRMNKLKEALTRLSDEVSGTGTPPPDRIEIPVCYGGGFGPDLDGVAARHGLPREEVIRLHTEPDYLVFMIGFTPGFPFLGGLPEQLHTPRLETPRAKVPAGSVGIANGQTGIYPIESPGGWQLIGRTPLKLFDPGRQMPFLVKAGDLLTFLSIDEEEFDRLAAKD